MSIEVKWNCRRHFSVSLHSHSFEVGHTSCAQIDVVVVEDAAGLGREQQSVNVFPMTNICWTFSFWSCIVFPNHEQRTSFSCQIGWRSKQWRSSSPFQPWGHGGHDFQSPAYNGETTQIHLQVRPLLITLLVMQTTKQLSRIIKQAKPLPSSFYSMTWTRQKSGLSGLNWRIEAQQRNAFQLSFVNWRDWKSQCLFKARERTLETTMSVTKKKLHLCKNGPIKIELKIVSMQSETHCEMEKITNNISWLDFVLHQYLNLRRDASSKEKTQLVQYTRAISLY